MQILKAELPSGVWTFPPGLRISTRAGVVGELLDVLYGPRRVSRGSSRVRVKTPGGQYLIDRDLGTGRARITPIGHARSPDASVEPGEWLLGRTREDLERIPSLPTPPDDPPGIPPESAWIQARIAHLRSSARRLAARNDASATAGDPLAPLARTAAGLFDSEARRIREAAARETVIADVLRILKDPERLLKASAHAARLRELSGRLRGLRETSDSRSLLTSPQVSLMVLAAGMAGLAAVAAGALLGAALLGQAGAALALGAALPWGVLRLRRQHSQRRTERALAGVREEALAALVRAQVLPGDAGPTAEMLEEASLRVAHRDHLHRVRHALEGLLPPDEERQVRERRLDVVTRGVPEEITSELADLARHEPLLALPGLLQRCRAMLSAEREETLREGAVEGLLREADNLEQGSRTPAPDAAGDELRADVLRHASDLGGWPVFVACEGEGGLARTIEALRDLPTDAAVVLTTPGEPNPARLVRELDPETRGDACVLAPEPSSGRHSTRPAAQ